MVNKKVQFKKETKTRGNKRTKPWNYVELVREIKSIAGILETKRSQGASIVIKTT